MLESKTPKHSLTKPNSQGGCSLSYQRLRDRKNGERRIAVLRNEVLCLDVESERVSGQPGVSKRL